MTQVPCTHPREVIAVDSTGHEIIAPCHQCLLEWRKRQIETATIPRAGQKGDQELAEG